MIPVLAVLCVVCGALYMEKLARGWRETPITEKVDAGHANWLLVLLLALAALVVIVGFGGMSL